MAGGEIGLLMDQLEEAFQRRAWHGTTLMGSLRGLRQPAASWRPGPGRHNIWELVVHCAYWKYAVSRRLLGGPKGRFALAGSNFFRRDGGSALGWRQDLELLRSSHRDLLGAVAAVPMAGLGRKPPGSKHTISQLIRGAAAHDLYHTGQIQLIKRLHR